jgi:hypothetical protein
MNWSQSAPLSVLPSTNRRSAISYWPFWRVADFLRLLKSAQSALICYLLSAMASDDVYVQITATPVASGRPKSIVVLVPRKSIDDCRMSGKNSDDNSIARYLADPVATYVFSHRASFGNFKVNHSFSLTPPHEIEGEPAEFTQGDLKAWLL